MEELPAVYRDRPDASSRPRSTDRAVVEEMFGYPREAWMSRLRVGALHDADDREESIASPENDSASHSHLCLCRGAHLADPGGRPLVLP